TISGTLMARPSTRSGTLPLAAAATAIQAMSRRSLASGVAEKAPPFLHLTIRDGCGGYRKVLGRE
ncbi:hypothetical protein Q2941_51240, partial [Bradyrhizobium sp. UFLA05-153]